MNLPRVNTVPYLAKGAVIPPRSEFLAYLQGKLGECAAVLVNTAIDTEVPAQIRVNAANAALSQCSQWTKNVDMIERLETMEELMSRVEQEQKSQKRGK